MNRVAFCVLIVLFAVSTAGCNKIYSLLQKEGAEEKELVGVVVPYEKNVKIAEVQRLLKLYGYRVGKADGVLGANTRNAIEQFQEDNGLPLTRFVDNATWEKLNVFKAAGLVVNNSLNLKVVQQALKNAGFDPGPVDGRPGAQTQEAIMAFQKACQLKPDGKTGFKTLRRLSEYLPKNDSAGN